MKVTCLLIKLSLSRSWRREIHVSIIKKGHTDPYTRGSSYLVKDKSAHIYYVQGRLCVSWRVVLGFFLCSVLPKQPLNYLSILFYVMNYGQCFVTPSLNVEKQPPGKSPSTATELVYSTFSFNLWSSWNLRVKMGVLPSYASTHDDHSFVTMLYLLN